MQDYKVALVFCLYVYDINSKDIRIEKARSVEGNISLGLLVFIVTFNNHSALSCCGSI
jgi:hypothetical protein